MRRDCVIPQRSGERYYDRERTRQTGGGIDPQPLGDRPDVLSMRDRPTNLPRYLVGKYQRPFLMAAGADTSLATGKGDHHFMMAVGTPYPGKTEVQVAAAEKLAHCLVDHGPPDAITPLITLGVDALEVGIVPLEDPVQRRGPWPARTIHSGGI